MDVGHELLLRERSDAKTLNLAQKQKLARKEKPFTLKEGKMYKVGQDNKLHKWLTTSKAQFFSKGIH